MDPITNLLTALALARATRSRLPRFGTAMLVTSGIAPDLDFVSYFFGPAAFLRFHRGVLHSLLGSVAMCGLIAAAYYWLDRARKKTNHESGTANFTFHTAFMVCVAGAGAHIILDLASGIGVQLFWPFRASWESWDLLPHFDIWVLLMLAAGLSLPHLGRLVSDEIGERKRGAPGTFAAMITLALIVLYAGGREVLHSRAIGLLQSRDYNGQPPQKAGAFPSSSSNPFAWRGLVATPDAIEELSISLLPGATFDPDRAVPHYKPDQSTAIAAAQNTPDGRLFLNYARFPLATTEPEDTGFDVMLRDLRFPAGDTSIENVMLDTQLDANSQIIGQRLSLAGAERRR
jgi:inner membrane protein